MNGRVIVAQVRKNSAAEDVSKSQFIIFDSCIVLFVDNVVIRENVLTPKWFYGVWSFSFPFCLVLSSASWYARASCLELGLHY